MSCDSELTFLARTEDGREQRIQIRWGEAFRPYFFNDLLVVHPFSFVGDLVQVALEAGSDSQPAHGSSSVHLVRRRIRRSNRGRRRFRF